MEGKKKKNERAENMEERNNFDEEFIECLSHCILRLFLYFSCETSKILLHFASVCDILYVFVVLGLGLVISSYLLDFFAPESYINIKSVRVIMLAVWFNLVQNILLFLAL